MAVSSPGSGKRAPTPPGRRRRSRHRHHPTTPPPGVTSHRWPSHRPRKRSVGFAPELTAGTPPRHRRPGRVRGADPRASESHPVETQRHRGAPSPRPVIGLPSRRPRGQLQALPDRPARTVPALVVGAGVLTPARLRRAVVVEAPGAAVSVPAGAGAWVGSAVRLAGSLDRPPEQGFRRYRRSKISSLVKGGGKAAGKGQVARSGHDLRAPAARAA